MDFRHPFITNPRIAIYYGLFWVVAATANVLVLTLGNNINVVEAIVQVCAFLLSFAVIGAAIWYVIKFSTLENNSFWRIVIAHAIAATVIIFIWIYFGVVIIKIFHPTPSRWIESQIANRIFAGYALYTIYVVFFYAVNYYNGFKEKLRSEGKLKALVKEAELHALKSQINPHFLFNSLNSISSLTMTDPSKAQEMVINLSQLMRYSLKHDQNEKVSFKQELENNQLYLQIEKVRFGKKLNPSFEIEEQCLSAEIPNMILQPLYENAIKYGVYEATEPVDVKTFSEMTETGLKIVISNTYDPDVLSKRGEGIGLRNIRERLQIIYGNPGLLKISDNKKEFKVTLTIPQKIM
ncbi:MAG: histidine kinase [Prolixibacteraceae bacterium]|nr:histidine kinase [Prolixibacteraceae bacterium]